MTTSKVLITCPPMLSALSDFQSSFQSLGWDVTAPAVTQTLSVEELLPLVAENDGWIIGDDPAEASVVEAGRKGRLRAAVKWGVGVDNVDFKAFEHYGIPVTNTPGMFGNEVADIALGYLIALARHTFEIHQAVRNGGWPKPSGRSLKGSRCAVVGFGDIGQQLTRRLESCGMELLIYDPAHSGDERLRVWPQGLQDCEFICFTCALTAHNRHMLNAAVLDHHCRPGVRIINVSRGPLLDERALIDALKSGQVAAVALDVFETEPLAADNELRLFPQNVFGTHNASNTVQAVRATSLRAIDLLSGMLSSQGK